MTARRLLVAVVLAVALSLPSAAQAAPAAVPSSWWTPWTPTISNGGIAFGSYRTNRRGYWEVCFQYVNRTECYRLAAFSPVWLWWP